MGVKLPAEYQEVEYLESNGSQYINSGIVPDSNDVYSFRGVFRNLPDAVLFGCRSSNAYDYGNQMYLNRHIATSTAPNLIALIVNTAHSLESDFSKNIFFSTESNLPLSVEENNVSIIDHINATEWNPTFPIYLLGFNNLGSNLSSVAGGKLFYFKIDDRCYFVPCYRKSDFEPGMYDLVSKSFFTNQGTGEFLVGPDVVDHISPRLMDRRRVLIAKLTSLFKNIITSQTGLVSFNTNFAKPMKVTCEFSPKQEGTGDPSPENVRPITAWDGANITGAAKNLFHIDLNNVKNGNSPNSGWNGNIKTIGNVNFECVVDNDNNVIEIRATTTSEGTSNRILYLPVDYFPAGRFTLSGLPENMITDEGYMGYNLHGYDAYYMPGTIQVTFNVSHPFKANRRLWLTVREGSSKTFIFRPQIRIATDIDETFELFHGKVLTVPFNQPGTYDFFPIQAGTGDPSPENIRPITPGLTLTRDDNTTLEVWGGSLTVNSDGTGTITSKYYQCVYDGVNKKVNTSYLGTNIVAGDVYTVLNGLVGSAANVYCNTLKPVRASATTVNTISWPDIGNLYLVFSLIQAEGSNVTTSAECIDYVNNWLQNNPTSVVYKLLEVDYQTYTLSVAETSRAFEALGLGKNLGPLYGGTVTLNEDGSADAVVTWVAGTLNGSRDLAWGTSYGEMENSSAVIFYHSHFPVQKVDTSTDIPPIVCETLPVVSTSTFTTVDADEMSCSIVSGVFGITLRLTAFKGVTTSQARTYLNEHPVNIVYLTDSTSAQTHYHFDNIGQLQSFLGTNNVWSDLNGPITVEYYNNKKE